MQLFFTVKQLGRRKDFLTLRPYTFDASPRTLRELIAELVRQEVRRFNAVPTEDSSMENRPAKVETVLRFLTETELQQTAEQVGKVGFNARYDARKADESQAVTTAIQAFEDGIYRVFQESRTPEHTPMELEQLDTKLDLADGDRLTLIRLVMLAGRMW